MFCFGCGAEMMRVDGELRCMKTGMGLSRDLEERLLRIYDPATPKPVSGRTNLETRGWHCPGCGKAIMRTCADCKVTLDDHLIFLLVEIHPHEAPVIRRDP